jgi:hypothetical protein
MPSSSSRNEIVPSYEIAVRGDVVWAVAHGKMGLPLRHEMLDQVHAQAIRANLNRVVFDFRLARFADGILGMNECVKRMKQSPLPNSPVYALLCSHRTADIDFLETICGNQGLNFTVFTDGEEAVHWLESVA